MCLTKISSYSCWVFYRNPWNVLTEFFTSSIALIIVFLIDQLLKEAYFSLSFYQVLLYVSEAILLVAYLSAVIIASWWVIAFIIMTLSLFLEVTYFLLQTFFSLGFFWYIFYHVYFNHLYPFVSVSLINIMILWLSNLLSGIFSLSIYGKH